MGDSNAISTLYYKLVDEGIVFDDPGQKNAIKALDYNNVGAINKVSFKHNDLTKNIINQRLAISNNNSSDMKKVSYIDQSNDKSFFNFKQIFSDLEGVDGWWSKFYGGTTDRETENFIGNNGYDDDYYGMVFGLDGKQGNEITGITLSVQEGNMILKLIFLINIIIKNLLLKAVLIA